MHAALQQEDTRAEAAEILRELVEAITLTPEDGALRIDLKGDLAGILRLSAGGKKPAAIGDGLEQIKLVAGERNHLCRTTIGRQQVQIRGPQLP